MTQKKARRKRMAGEEKTALRKEIVAKRVKLRGRNYRKASCRRNQEDWYAEPPKTAKGDVIRGRTFEDEYRLYRKTRGRQGWNPNPDYRGEENPVYLASKSPYGSPSEKVAVRWLNGR